jgi:serine/threonine protein kinase
MWSFGCVIAEMKLSYPIFSGENEDEQVGLITEVIGLPKSSFYKNTQRGDTYFGIGSAPLRDRDGIEIQPKARLLTNLFTDPDFSDFLSQIFVWDPKERITPIEALKHKWIMKGLPN